MVERYTSEFKMLSLLTGALIIDIIDSISAVVKLLVLIVTLVYFIYKMEQERLKRNAERIRYRREKDEAINKPPSELE